MNDKIRNLQTTVLSDNWYILRKVSYELLGVDGEWQPQSREIYDRSNDATILLYNKANQSK